MLLKVKDLALRKIVFDENFPPGVIDLVEGVEQKTLLKASGRAEVLRENRVCTNRVLSLRLLFFRSSVLARCNSRYRGCSVCRAEEAIDIVTHGQPQYIFARRKLQRLVAGKDHLHDVMVLLRCQRRIERAAMNA